LGLTVGQNVHSDEAGEEFAAAGLS
jgi:hypothetical protein